MIRYLKCTWWGFDIHYIVKGFLFCPLKTGWPIWVYFDDFFLVDNPDTRTSDLGLLLKEFVTYFDFRTSALCFSVFPSGIPVLPNSVLSPAVSNFYLLHLT